MMLIVFSNGNTLNIASWVSGARVEVVADAQRVGERHLRLHAVALAHGVRGDVAQRRVTAGGVVAAGDVPRRVGEDGVSGS